MTLSFTHVIAQNFNADPANSEVTITGTSTIHDWESTAEEFSGTASLTIVDGQLISIENLTFNVLVEGIKSGKRGMDKKTYGALDEKKHPNIVFNLTKVNTIENETISAAGDLTIAGVTKSIEMKVAYAIGEEGTITFTGEQPITMTDYKIKPPKAVFGTIKCGDDVVVHFDTNFTDSTNL